MDKENLRNFYKDYMYLLQVALENGINHSPLLKNLTTADMLDARTKKRFLSECHRGYERAQNLIINWLEELKNDTSLTSDEKLFRELILRKVSDSMAVVMLQMRKYVIRRLSLHDSIPKVDLAVVREAQKSANKMNNESRQTFALLADLTTFIHVSDIVRIDYRGVKPTLKLIELKSGKVNDMLLEHLENYEPTKESMTNLLSTSTLDEKHKKQAKRMLQQTIRLANIDQILKTDQGTDNASETKIYLSKDVIEEEYFEEFIDELCDKAKENGYASGTVSSCLHFGVGYSPESTLARKNALSALEFAMQSNFVNATTDLEEIYEQVIQVINKKELFKVYDLLLANLSAPGCRPFPLWLINRSHLELLLTKNMYIFVAFDVASFIYLARKFGLEGSFTTRKEAHRIAEKIGSVNTPTWSHRVLELKTKNGKVIRIMSGTISRFINDLLIPSIMLKAYNDTEISRKQETPLKTPTAKTLIKEGLLLD